MKGRMKKLLALILAANLSLSPVFTLAEEQTELSAQEPATETMTEPATEAITKSAAEAASEKTASAEASAELETPADVPEKATAGASADAQADPSAQTPVDPAANTPADVPAETPAETSTESSAAAADTQTDPSPTATTEAPTDPSSAESSTDPSSTAPETPIDSSSSAAPETSADSSSTAASGTSADTSPETPARTPAEDTAQEEEQQQILKIESLTAQYDGDLVLITIVTKDKDYNKLYIGKREDEKKEPVIEGEENETNTYTFQFEVKPEELGQKLFFVPCETASDQWYVEEELFLRLPKSAIPENSDASSDVSASAGEGKASDEEASSGADGSIGADADWLADEEDAGESDEDQTESSEGTGADWLNEEEAPAKNPEEEASEKNAEEMLTEEIFTEDVAEEESEELPAAAIQTIATEMLETAITKLQVVKEEDGEEFTMFKISNGYSVKEENGELSIIFTTESTTFNGIYLGSKDDEIKEPVIKAPEEEAPFTFSFKVPLDKAGSRISIALQKKKDGSWYSGKNLFLTIPKADGEAEATPTPAPTPTPTPTPTGSVLPDGVYRIPADGAVTDAAMFKVVETTLTSSDGSMTAKIILSGTGYDYLYMGTAEEALAADESKWIPVAEELKDYYSDGDGKSQDRRAYVIPVTALDVPLAVASHSQKNATWTSRTITFSSEKAVRMGDSQTPTPTPESTPTPSPSSTPEISPTPTPETSPTPAPETTPTPSPTPTPGTNPTPTPGGETGGTTDPVDNSTTLADGSYVPQNFGFEGGTGKTTISCTGITVKDGKAYATIVFSSDKFQYVKANGEIFENPVVENGTAAFTIPVALNQKNRILAMTTAMGTPHEVEYSITASYVQQTPETPADGIYQPQVKADSTSGMFRVIDSRLTVKNGKMTAVIMLSGTGYDYLYTGTKEQAVSAKKSSWIPVKKTYSNYYSEADQKTQDRNTYEIAVSALDTPIALAARSARDAADGKSQPWYDRTVTFLSGNLKKVDSAEFPDNTVKPTPTPNPGNENNQGNTNGNNSSGNTGNNSSGSSGNANGNSGSGNGGTDSGNNSNSGSGSSGTSSGGNSTSGSTGGSSSSGLNGSTSATGSTTLADGEYTPDSFSFSGGTGKVNISCTKITVKNGQAYATIVFDSDKYQYVKAGGTKVTGTQGGGTSTFEIPVTLNANNTIYAMTTAMSQPHEIAYTLYIGLNAAKGTTTAGGSGSSGGSASAAAAGNGQTKTLGTISEDEDAPEIAGLTYVGSLDRDYAENFKVHYYEDDFVILEINVANGTGRTDLDEAGNVIQEETSAEAAENADATGESETAGDADAAEGSEISGDSDTAEGSDEGEDPQEKSFYEETTVKYLLVPEDVEVPAGIDKEMQIVRQPVKHAYVASSNALKILDKMNAVESIAAVGFEQEECKADSVVQAMEKEEILYAGSSDSPQFRDLVTAKSDLAILPEDILPEAQDNKVETENSSAEAQAEDTAMQDDEAQAEDADAQTKRMQELGDQFALLGIPMIIDRSSAEKEKLGQYEWCKVYGLLFGKEEAAVKLYEDAVKALGGTKEESQEG